MRSPATFPGTHGMRDRQHRVVSLLFTGLTGVAAFLIVAILAVILIHVAWHGREAFSLRFLTSGVGDDAMDPGTAGVFPMLIGTVAKVFLMTLLVLPVGVLTAIYLSECTRPESRLAGVIRCAVRNLAGVPSVVFGLFGMAFFVGVVGGSLDEMSGHRGEPVWGRPALIWASFTLAVMTLPVVIVTTEEAFGSVPRSLREASLALGATRMQTVLRVLLPQALPGVLTGAILAISRAAGEVAPILFTGAAYYMPRLPESLSDQFMDLGYHAFALATQTPQVNSVQPVLYATVLTLLALTLALNVVALLIHNRLRRAAIPWPI